MITCEGLKLSKIFLANYNITPEYKINLEKKSIKYMRKMSWKKWDESYIKEMDKMVLKELWNVSREIVLFAATHAGW